MRISGKLRRSGITASLVAAFVFLGIGFSATSAAASPADDRESFQVVAADESSGDYSAQAFTASCFGNTGTFKDGSQVLYIDWSYGVPECFGVAPSGNIYHTWQGANAWHEMPGNGRADDINYLYDWGNGDRTVAVWTGSFWCQDYFYGSGWTGSWYQC